MRLAQLIVRTAVLVVLLAVGHITAIYFNLYEGRVWIDMPLHFIAGIALGVIWIWILDYREARGVSYSDLLLLTMSLVGWVLLLSFSWELFEFAMREYFLKLAQAWKIYPPNPKDTLSDMIFGLLGGLLTVPYKLLARK